MGARARRHSHFASPITAGHGAGSNTVLECSCGSIHRTQPRAGLGMSSLRGGGLMAVSSSLRKTHGHARTISIPAGAKPGVDPAHDLGRGEGWLRKKKSTSFADCCASTRRRAVRAQGCGGQDRRGSRVGQEVRARFRALQEISARREYSKVCRGSPFRWRSRGPILLACALDRRVSRQGMQGSSIAFVRPRR